MLADLTVLERQVVTASIRGETAQPDVVVEPANLADLAVTDDPALRVRAELIRELLLGRHGDLDPAGLRVRGVRVVGHLRLDHVLAVAGLALTASALPDGITCEHARLPYLTLDDSVIAGIAADGVRIDSGMSLHKATVTHASEHGAVRLIGAHIGGHLELDQVEVTNTDGPTLDADGLRIDSDLFLQNATLTGTGQDGAVRLVGAHIGGHLSLDRAEVTNLAGPVLDADVLRTDSSVSLENATLTGAGEEGAVRLVGAHIGGQLGLDQAKVTNTTGPAFYSERLRTDSSLFLRDATLTGTGERGVLCLLDAHVGGHLRLDQVEVVNDAGPALIADGLRTDSELSLRGATLTGPGEDGTICLTGAHIGGRAVLRPARVTNNAGPALIADGLRTDSDLILRDATLTGAGEHGTIRLLSAHIGGQAVLWPAQVSNNDGPLIRLNEAEVAGTLFLSASVICPHPHTETDRPNRACDVGKGSERRISLDGLTYPRLGDLSWREWLHLLVHHTTHYAPQPFQQLAAVERAAGHDNNARYILITQQHTLLDRDPDALGGRLARLRHRLWGWLGRYGYRAHRLAAALILVLLLAAALGYTAGHLTTRPGHHAAERIPPPATTTPSYPQTPGTPCATVELIGLGIDRGLPLATTGVRARCDLDTTTTWGEVFTAALWALHALVWALATLTIAAYTGLVRKPT